MQLCKRAVHVWPLLAFVGCGSSDAVKIGGAVVGQPIRPNVVVKYPIQKRSIKQGEKLAVRISLNIIGRENIPNYVGVSLNRGGLLVNSIDLKISKQTGTVLELENKIRATSLGENLLKIHVIYHQKLISLQGGGATNRVGGPIPFTFDGPEPIEVIR